MVLHSNIYLSSCLVIGYGGTTIVNVKIVFLRIRECHFLSAKFGLNIVFSI